MCDAFVISNTIPYSWESKIWSIAWSGCCNCALSWSSNWIAANCWILKGKKRKKLYGSLAFSSATKVHPSILIYEMPSYFVLPKCDQIRFRSNVFILLCFIRGEGGTEFPEFSLLLSLWICSPDKEPFECKVREVLTLSYRLMPDSYKHENPSHISVHAASLAANTQ